VIGFRTLRGRLDRVWGVVTMTRFFAATALAVVLSAGFAAAVTLGQDERGTREKRVPDYAVDAQGVLYEIECDKLEWRKCGQVRVGTDAPVLIDLAATLDGYLYGISLDALYLINLEKTNESVKLGAHGLTNPYGMAIGPDGALLASTRGGSVYALDKKNGQATHLGDMGGGFGCSGDLALTKDTVVATVKSNGGEQLVKLDPKTGRAKLIGAIKDQDGREIADIYGLIWRKDILYGLSANGWIVRIDPFTGRCVRLVQSGVAWYGATDYERL
jgi:outer membrane protein assembly factor BamB